MKRAFILATVLMLPFCGCTTIAKKGLHEVMGASGEVVDVRAPKISALRTYKSVRVGEVNNEIGRVCPAELHKALKTYLASELAAAKDVFPGGEPTLTVDVDIHYAQTEGSVISSNKLLIARVRLTGQDASPVGEVILLADSKAMRTSPTDLAKAGAEKLVDYMRKRIKPKEDA